jgi:hypothetical protein
MSGSGDVNVMLKVVEQALLALHSRFHSFFEPCIVRYGHKEKKYSDRDARYQLGDLLQDGQ